MSTGGGTMTAQDIARLRELHAAVDGSEVLPVELVESNQGTRLRDAGGEYIALMLGTTYHHADTNEAIARYAEVAMNALPDVLTALEQARAERDAAHRTADMYKHLEDTRRQERDGYHDGLIAAQREAYTAQELARTALATLTEANTRCAALTAERDAALAELAAVRAEAAQDRRAGATKLAQADAEIDALRAQLDAVPPEGEVSIPTGKPQPTQDENSKAEFRIKRIDAMYAQYGNDRNTWPWPAQETFAKLDAAQTEFEAKYC